MNDNDVERRFDQLMRSPGGRAMLILLDQHAIDLSTAVEAPYALHLVSAAVGQLNPWAGDREAKTSLIQTRGAQLGDLARRLVAQPGIDWWWSPLLRDRQVWIQPTKDSRFPAPDRFPTPTSPPGPDEHYAQRTSDRFSTSTEFASTTSQLAEAVSGETDWWIDEYVAQLRRLTVSPDARILEIDSAEDWHAFVAEHGSRSEPHMSPHPWPEVRGRPWAENDGLVPDWASAARAWDGIHVTLWAFLTAMQVRIESEVGWTEPWTWGGEETTWLHWSFDSVEEMSPIQASPNDESFEHGWRIEVDVPPNLPRMWFIT
jgi:hypothetical protein